MEVLTAVFHRGPRHVTGLNSQVGMLVSGILRCFFPLVCPLHLFQLDLAAQTAKDDGSLLALDGFYLANAIGAFDADIIPNLQRTVRVVEAGFGTFSQLLADDLLLCTFFLLALGFTCFALLHLA